MTNPAFNLAPQLKLSFPLWLSAACLLLFGALWSYFSSPLRKYPGPLLASKKLLVQLLHCMNLSAARSAQRNGTHADS